MMLSTCSNRLLFSAFSFSVFPDCTCARLSQWDAVSSPQLRLWLDTSCTHANQWFPSVSFIVDSS